MNKKGIFNLLGSFKMTDRGMILSGDIMEGSIKSGDYITFYTGVEIVTFKISALEFIDWVSKGESKIGLVFNYDDDQRIQELELMKIVGQTCDVTGE